MPDAAYLYRTGHWIDAGRTQRSGSEALDYVGKTFRDQFPPCLIVKFACHKGKFNDGVKWYVYPEITQECDIWEILTYAWGNGVSVGHGFHKTVHPLLTSTSFLPVGKPGLRAYEYHYNQNDAGNEANFYCGYRRCILNEEISGTVPFVLAYTLPDGYGLYTCSTQLHVCAYDPLYAAAVLKGNASSPYHSGSAYLDFTGVEPEGHLWFTQPGGWYNLYQSWKKQVTSYGLLYTASVKVRYDRMQFGSASGAGAYNSGGYNLVAYSD